MKFSWNSNKVWLDEFYTWLMSPVHGSTLGLFRIGYSYVMLAQILKWSIMFPSFLSSAYTFPYPGVTWIHPVEPFFGQALLLICFLSSLALGVGFMTKIASVVNFLVFGYLFHLCQSFYNNHYVLMCHINFVGCFVNWNTWGSIDAYFRQRKRKVVENTVPYWHLLLMQLLFCVPYFFGGIAKMNSDWMFRGQPLIDWFARREGFFYRQWWFPWFISWSGMLYDLSVNTSIYTFSNYLLFRSHSC